MKSLKVLLIALTCMSYIAADLVFLNADTAKTCPKYSCDTSLPAETCAKGTGKFSDGTRNVGVNKCVDPKYCPFVKDEFQTDAEKSNTCQSPATPPTNNKLPGEACTKDDDCRTINWWDGDNKPQTAGKCKDTKCQGSPDGKKCDNDNSCFIGSSCPENADASLRVCTAQVAAGGKCTTSYDCQNNQFCNKNVCTDYFSLAVGASLTDVKIGDRPFACVTGLFDPLATEQVCLERRYVVPDGATVSSGVLKCDVGSKCKYNNYSSSDDAAKPVSTTPIELDCVCPYSGDGIAYCPYSTNAKDNTLGGIEAKKKLYNNKNHTLNRALGDSTKNDLKCSAISGSIFYKGAPQCVIDAAGFTGCSSAFKVALSFISIAIMFILF